MLLTEIIISLRLNIILVLILQNFINKSYAWFENCNKTTSLSGDTNHVWRIDSPNYPYQYPPGSSCKYQIIAPEGYRVTIVCNTKLNEYPEHLYISTSGDNSLANSESFTGEKNNIQRTSINNKMTVAYILSGSQRTGTFTCGIKVSLVQQQQQCDCGWSISSKITGGTNAGLNEYPFMCGLLTKDQFACGCVIISSRYTLSCAHCFNLYSGSDLQIRVGDHDLTKSNESYYSSTYYIQSVLKHEFYNSDQDLYDIALIKTTSNIKFSQGVGPICLPFNYKYSFTGSSVDIIGWGTLFFGGPKSPVLQKAMMKIISPEDCKRYYSNVTPSQHICTQSSKNDSCQFDSGGPVIFRSSRMILVGLISFGKACGTGDPSVNTRITSYLDWIQKNSGAGLLCVK